MTEQELLVDCLRRLAENSILHKLVWNRITPSDRQMGDAAGVVSVQGEKLDKSYLKHWADALGFLGS
jgi:hypothetical protein